MFYKEGSIKTPYDFDKTENPTSEMSTDNSSPDAWVRPEMLKRISDRRFIDQDKMFSQGE